MRNSNLEKQLPPLGMMFQFMPTKKYLMAYQYLLVLIQVVISALEYSK